MIRILLLLQLWTTAVCVSAQTFSPKDYYTDILRHGQSPESFVSKCLSSYDLLVFDDALHNAYEPFEFYKQLVNDPDISKNINIVFLEVISTTSQPLIDSFLNSASRDSTILIRAFQDDYTGMGWRYQTYLDLFNTVWDHNQNLPDSSRIKIVGVNPPIYWEAIHSALDYQLFQNTLKSRDYFMYLEILEQMKGFKANKKGMFLCNTRHAYKNIRKPNGELYWNTMTFFTERNPGKAISIRIHNVTLSLENQISPVSQKTANGLGEPVYKWIKMDNGHWDSAFLLNLNRPVALPLKNTCFGKCLYVGNLMLNVRKGTTMADAYDALVFLAPLDQLHFSARMSYLYTPTFRSELERRIRLINGSEYANFLKENNAADFEEFYNKNFIYSPVRNNELIKQ